MRVNLNTSARVTLTMTGAAIYNEWMGQFPRHTRERVHPGQVLKLQLWSLMKAFGPSIFMGMGEVPFVENVLEILPDRDYAAEVEYASWFPVVPLGVDLPDGAKHG